MKLVQTAVQRPVSVCMAALAAVVFGLVALQRLDVNLLPEIRYPTLTIQTELPGSAPADVENLVTRPLEESVGVVSGLRSVHSISQAGLSQITLEFDWKTAMDHAGLDVREKLDLVRLPTEAGMPVLLKYDPSLDPVLRIGLWGDLPLVQVRTLAEEVLKTDIEAIQGVAAARVAGGLEEEIQILVDERRITALGLDILQVERVLARQAVDASGGRLRDRGAEYIVRTVRRLDDLQDIERITVGYANGRPVALGEVASVVRTHKERTDATYIDGRESVEIAVYKEGDANAIEVSRRVHAALGRIERRLPAGLEREVLFDQSVYISQSIDEVRRNALLGGLLAILVLYVFLRDLRSTLVIGLAIPLSIIATFILMLTRGVSLNVMSLGGLALGVGLLVDNSIVVLESIKRRRETAAEQSDQRAIAAAGAVDVAGAVTASTMTTIAVFVPVVFVVVGVAGQIFRDQALTVTFSLLVSLLVSLTFTPMAASLGVEGDSSGARPGWRHQWAPRRIPNRRWMRVFSEIGHFLVLGLPLALVGLIRIVGRFTRCLVAAVLYPLTALHGMLWPRLASGYDRLLAVALRARLAVLLAVGLIAAAGGMLLPRLGADLIPPLSQGTLSLQLELSEGTPLDRTERVCGGLQRQLARVPGVRRVAATVGVSRDQGGGPIRRKENHAEIHLLLDSASPEIEADVLQRVRRIVAETTDVRLEVRRPALLNLSAPVQVDVFGHDLQALQRASQSVAAAFQGIRGLRDVRQVMVPGSPEILISLDRDRLGLLQLDEEDVFRTVRAKIAGVVPARFRDGERHLDIRLRGRSDDSATLTAVHDLVVAQSGEIAVTLGSVANLIESQGPAEIHRLGGRRVAMVTADLAGRDQGSVNSEIAEVLRGLTLPAGTSARLGRQSDEMRRSYRSLQLAVLLAVFLVYLVMASQFESVLHPLIIMVTVPLALSGAVFGLAVTGRPLSIFAVIGAIMLSGIVVNNGIVLIDRMNQLRRSGLEMIPAVRQAGRERLRPILMTTATTVLGLLPMAIGLGEGAELRSPLAMTVISGLLLSAGLTLVAVPVLYTLISSLPGVRRAAPYRSSASQESLVAAPSGSEG